MQNMQNMIGIGIFTIFLLVHNSCFAKDIVDVELILAIDCSYSVDEKEYRLQTYGIAQALRNPEAIRAILSAPYRSIAISIVQWSDAHSQYLALPWFKIDSEKSAYAIADIIANLPRRSNLGATSISGALKFSISTFQQSPFISVKRIVDISSDGRNNNGDDLDLVRFAAVASGITVNGLAILTDDPTLDIYYKNKVVVGPGSFVVRAENYNDYVKAMERKILKEVRHIPIGAVPPTDKAPLKQLAKINLKPNNNILTSNVDRPLVDN